MARVDPVERRCVLTGEVRDEKDLLRFALAPDGTLVPDLKRELPGRGVWLTLDRALLEDGLKSGKFRGQASRTLKENLGPHAAPDSLAALVDGLMAKRLLSLLGLECRAGRTVFGAEKVHAGLKAGGIALLVSAADGAADGRRKLGALAFATGVEEMALFTRDELSLALGRENVVHAAVKSGGAAKRLIEDTRRLKAWRGIKEQGEETV